MRVGGNTIALDFVHVPFPCATEENGVTGQP